MKEISIYLEFWDYLLDYGLKTIEVIESENAWNYQISPKEFSVIDTFNHAVRAVFEDAGNWFLKDSQKYASTNNPKHDLIQVIKRMKIAIQDFSKEELESKLTFQWGEETTIKDAIKQNMFHALCHFGQLRERVGIHRRNN